MQFIMDYSQHTRATAPANHIAGERSGNFLSCQFKICGRSGLKNIAWFCEPALSSVAKRTLSVWEVCGSIPGLVKSAQCRQQLAIVSMFLRSCVAQALSRVDGPRNCVIVREVCGSIPGLVKSAQCRQQLAIVSMFLRSCVAQALSCVDGPRNSLHASA